MSPEQLLADNVDHRSDLWSLGVVLYEMLAREVPFRRDREAAILYEILNRDPTPIEVHRPDTPAHLRTLIGKLLQKDPAQRPQSAAEVATHAARGRGGGTAGGAREIDRGALLREHELREGERLHLRGITEDIITDLSKVNELRVVSRTDMLPFRGKDVNIRQVADALRVNYVLEGSVRKAGSRIRITAQLISAKDGYHLWADRFDGSVEDIFDLQNEVSTQDRRRAQGVAVRYRGRVAGEKADRRPPRLRVLHAGTGKPRASRQEEHRDRHQDVRERDRHRRPVRGSVRRDGPRRVRTCTSGTTVHRHGSPARSR
jgi:TolB-like protein